MKGEGDLSRRKEERELFKYGYNQTYFGKYSSVCIQEKNLLF